MQFFRNFPSLDVFYHAVSKDHDFWTFILLLLTGIFYSYRSRCALIFLFCHSSLSLYIIIGIWVNVRFCVSFSLNVGLFATFAYCTFHRFWVYQVSVYRWFISINHSSTTGEKSRRVNFFRFVKSTFILAELASPARITLKMCNFSKVLSGKGNLWHKWPSWLLSSRTPFLYHPLSHWRWSFQITSKID